MIEYLNDPEIRNNPKLAERFKGILFFVDWLQSNHQDYVFKDNVNLDRDLMNGYYKYWKEL